MMIIFTSSMIVPGIVLAQAPAINPMPVNFNCSSPWLQTDKVKHFAVSAVITFSSYYIYREEFNNTESGSYYFSGGFTISLGALKEFYDYKHPENHHAEWRDFIADAAGVSLGLILAYTIIN